MDTLIDEITSAINEQRLFSWHTQRTADKQLNLTVDERLIVEAVGSVRENIISHCMVAAEELIQLFQRHSIQASFDIEDLNNNPPQYQQITLTLDCTNPTLALQLTKTLGYVCPLDTNTAGWHAYRRTARQITLTHTDTVTTRVNLRWKVVQSKSVPALFRVSQNDAMGSKWPAFFWPLVIALNPWHRIVARFSAKPKLHFGEWLGTPHSLLQPLSEFADITAQDVLVDLGCGDGRVLLHTASTIGCQAIGVERDADLCVLARQAAEDQQLTNLVTIHEGDLLELKHFGGNIIFLFIPMSAISTVLQNLLPQLPHGAKIIAHEQAKYEGSIPPSRIQPIISQHAVTVAYVWQA